MNFRAAGTESAADDLVTRAAGAAAPYIEAAIDQRVAPGAVLSVTDREGLSATLAFGSTTYGGAAVTNRTIYDLASVTKVTACLPSLLNLLEAGEVRLTDRVERFFSNAGWMQEPTLGAVTVEELLLHRSGLPAWRPLFAWVEGRGKVLANVLQSPLSALKDSYLYSDLGVILLTAIIERVAGKRIDEFVQEHVFEPLGMTGASYGPLPADTQVAPTEDDGLRGLMVGRVHDENADAMDGVSGHAGLFGAAEDLARYGLAWLRLEAPFANSDSLAQALEDRSSGVGPRRGLMWLLKEKGWSFGEEFSGSAYGHTGYTGTSVVVDPGAGMTIVLLTNRVHPRRGAADGIVRLRRSVHDAVVKAMT